MQSYTTHSPEILKILRELDELHRTPPGSHLKTVQMSTEYESQLRWLKYRNPDATKDELRYKFLPNIVRNVYNDWSSMKQEYLVHAGCKVWPAIPTLFPTTFNPEDRKAMDWDLAGFHERCQKQVHKQGFMSGPGDRALFGWTIEEGDAFSSPDDTVYWTDDEEFDGEVEDGGESKDKDKDVNGEDTEEKKNKPTESEEKSKDESE